MRLATRFKGQEVVIKEMSSDTPFVCVVRRLVREAGEVCYELESEGEIYLVAANSIQWIKPRKSANIIELNKLNFAPLRVFSGTN